MIQHQLLGASEDGRRFDMSHALMNELKVACCVVSCCIIDDDLAPSTEYYEEIATVTQFFV